VATLRFKASIDITGWLRGGLEIPNASFLSRGHDVILPKDTPLEIGFGPAHAKAP